MLQLPLEASDPLELELQGHVYHPMWVLGTERGSSARGVHIQPLSCLSNPLYFIFKVANICAYNRVRFSTKTIALPKAPLTGSKWWNMFDPHTLAN